MLVRLQSSSYALTCSGKVGCVLVQKPLACTVGLSKHCAAALCQELGAGDMQAEPIGSLFPVGKFSQLVSSSFRRRAARAC